MIDDPNRPDPADDAPDWADNILATDGETDRAESEASTDDLAAFATAAPPDPIDLSDLALPDTLASLDAEGRPVRSSRASAARERRERRQGRTPSESASAAPPSADDRPATPRFGGRRDRVTGGTRDSASPPRATPNVPLPRPTAPARVFSRADFAPSRVQVASLGERARGATASFNLGGLRVIAAIVGAIVVVALVVFLLGRLRNQPTGTQPNAIWLGTDWTYSTPDEGLIRAMVDRLRANRIGVLYAWVGQYQPDGTWYGAENFEQVSGFVQRMRFAYPEADLLGWVHMPGAGGTYQLDNAQTLAAVNALSGRIVDEFGFDGVVLNVDPVLSGDQAYLALLREARTGVGTDGTLAAAVPPDWTPRDAVTPLPPLIVPGTVWDDEYKQSVGLLVDDMIVMSYNTGLTRPEDYTLWVAYQTQRFAAALAALDAGTRLYIGIPTYDAEARHDPSVESIAAAAEGIRLGVERAESGGTLVRGAALYADWTTDDAEWSAFRESWADTQPVALDLP